MGVLIEKMAFHPPPRDDCAHTLRGKERKVLFTTHAKKPHNKVAMLYFQKSPSVTRTTLLFSHGNGEDLADDYPLLEKWHLALDVDILAYDYSGYGVSDGKKPTESLAYRDISAVFAFATSPQGGSGLAIPRSDIILVGRSLGSGPTTDLASKERGLGGMVLISPLMSCAAVGAGSPGYYAAYPFDVFPNFRKIGKVADYPVHLFHGDVDEIVPFNHGQALFKEVSKKNSATSKTWLPGTGHNNIEMVGKGALFYADFREFILKCKSFRQTA